MAAGRMVFQLGLSISGTYNAVSQSDTQTAREIRSHLKSQEFESHKYLKYTESKIILTAFPMNMKFNNGAQV